MMQLKVKDLLLTGTSPKQYIFFVFVIIAVACHHPDKVNTIPKESVGKIIYDTYIINRDSTDSWGDECLSKFNRKALIDILFKEVYDRKIIPLDYFSGEKLSPDQIRKMETDGVFSRQHISKIQFEEQWIWDSEKVGMQKQVISMTIAYEVYDNQGRSRGQKPIFKLVFRK